MVDGAVERRPGGDGGGAGSRSLRLAAPPGLGGPVRRLRPASGGAGSVGRGRTAGRGRAPPSGNARFESRRDRGGSRPSPVGREAIGGPRQRRRRRGSGRAGPDPATDWRGGRSHGPAAGDRRLERHGDARSAPDDAVARQRRRAGPCRGGRPGDPPPHLARHAKRGLAVSSPAHPHPDPARVLHVDRNLGPQELVSQHQCRCPLAGRPRSAQRRPVGAAGDRSAAPARRRSLERRPPDAVSGTAARRSRVRQSRRSPGDPRRRRSSHRGRLQGGGRPAPCRRSGDGRRGPLCAGAPAGSPRLGIGGVRNPAALPRQRQERGPVRGARRHRPCRLDELPQRAAVLSERLPRRPSPRAGPRGVAEDLGPPSGGSLADAGVRLAGGVLRRGPGIRRRPHGDRRRRPAAGLGDAARFARRLVRRSAGSGELLAGRGDDPWRTPEGDRPPAGRARTPSRVGARPGAAGRGARPRRSRRRSGGRGRGVAQRSPGGDSRGRRMGTQHIAGRHRPRGGARTAGAAVCRGDGRRIEHVRRPLRPQPRKGIGRSTGRNRRRRGGPRVAPRPRPRSGRTGTTLDAIRQRRLPGRGTG
ncbi:hypothetical protein LzC2_38870 [Planctomycetes bacterium LzC2]|uniref:LigA n=1 Tax=Alienimonas chondri TaxID=2681879 RepID=A0ABX1VI38_9PLAN|nr:hypothetical protein [Alienimonas chondri]